MTHGAEHSPPASAPLADGTQVPQARHALACPHQAWATPHCPFCQALDQWLRSGGVPRAADFTRAADLLHGSAPELVRARAEALAMLGELAGVAFVRRNRADNPGTDPALLEVLAGDPVVAVREATAANPRLPARMLDALSHDPVTAVRGLVARSPRLLDLDTLARLAVDPVPGVRQYARMNRAYAGLPDDVRAHAPA